jgi:hypothetical protein
MRYRPGGLPPSLLSLLFTLLPRFVPLAYADPATLAFKDCFENTASQAQKLNVSTVYAQVLENNDLGQYLDLTVLGQSPQQIFGMTNTSGSLCQSILSTAGWVNRLTFSSYSHAFYDDVRPHVKRMDEQLVSL